MSSEPPTSRAFIVTGASRGIGQAIVEELIRRGARVLGVARNFPGMTALHSASAKKKSPNITALTTPSLCGLE